MNFFTDAPISEYLNNCSDEDLLSLSSQILCRLGLPHIIWQREDAESAWSDLFSDNFGIDDDSVPPFTDELWEKVLDSWEWERLGDVSDSDWELLHDLMIKISDEEGYGLDTRKIYLLDGGRLVDLKGA